MTNFQNIDFLESKKSFQDFLIEQNISDNLLWVFSEDIIPQTNSYLIKTPLSSENEMLVKHCYETGLKRGLGICFMAFALLDSQPCCYIQLPSDSIESEYMMMSEGVKFSTKTDLTKAIPVNSSLSWSMYKFSHRIFAKNIIYPQKMPSKNCCF